MEGENRKLFLILSALFLYLVIGSVIFQALESKVPHLVDEKVKEIHHDFTTKYKYNVSWDKFKADVVDKLKRVYQKNGFAVGEWNFYTSLYFCGSVVTTIGKNFLLSCLNENMLSFISFPQIDATILTVS